MIICMCLEEQQDIYTALTFTGWTWPPGSGATWNPTMHPQTYLKKGLTEHQVLAANGSKTCFRWNILKTSVWCYRYRHELAHDGQRIYILGGGTSWTSYPMDKVVQIGTHWRKIAHYSQLLFLFISNQIHAYNLETNFWEEIVTKPHPKIGLLVVIATILVEASVKIWRAWFWQDIQQPAGVTAVCRSKMVSRNLLGIIRTHLFRLYVWSTPYFVSPIRGVYMWGL